MARNIYKAQFPMSLITGKDEWRNRTYKGQRQQQKMKPATTGHRSVATNTNQADFCLPDQRGPAVSWLSL